MRFVTVAVCALFACLSCSVWAEKPSRPLSSFASAKMVARDVIYSGHEESFYCGCTFVAKGKSGGTIDPDECGYESRKNAKRGKILEWEHVMPASFFGKNRSCWKSGHESCVKLDGTAYKGRTCCAKVDKTFKRIEADLHNLVPSVGELNGDRSNLLYGMVDGEERLYGQCDFEIGGTPRVTEPRPEVRGEAARIWLYMSDTYGIKLKPAEREMFEQWSEEKPATRKEKLRNKRIEAAQGNKNPFVP
jgi:deoxyribonuclease-1